MSAHRKSSRVYLSLSRFSGAILKSYNLFTNKKEVELFVSSILPSVAEKHSKVFCDKTRIKL